MLKDGPTMHCDASVGKSWSMPMKGEKPEQVLRVDSEHAESKARIYFRTWNQLSYSSPLSIDIVAPTQVNLFSPYCDGHSVYTYNYNS